MRGGRGVRGTRPAAVFAAAVLAVTATSACAEFQAQMAADRGLPFGSGEFDGRVAARSGLHVRTEPTTASSSLAILPYDLALRITCKTDGESIEGNPEWYRLGYQRWVSARYVTTDGPAPDACD